MSRMTAVEALIRSAELMSRMRRVIRLQRKLIAIQRKRLTERATVRWNDTPALCRRQAE
jgi:hypothetical protein